MKNAFLFMADSGDNKKFYRWVKIAGLLYFIPLMLAAGPFTGYMLGAFLTKQFDLPSSVPVLGFVLGMLIAIQEILRIIRKIQRIEEKSKHGL